ncbi:TCR/Tet family MFS transporter [Chitinimonas sp. BJB300]|uniref:TCR/Tet family MFS transporter n=1 Tax=Chitinimonas sp. BJB300 TaxID=1559339 RepID=UPI000C108313|nr:TCR/Tet family MFS transporter [Chitinimonas sp. BJB300]PHV13463.1 MFS transporter [Chitinimonas sp. BJB300]TSJ89852.1 TCR/Tet family MFS transporter [Chitinimonas sp. BJB300]
MLQPLFKKNRQASQTFILITIFLDVLGIGLIIPVLPALVGQFTSSPDEQAHWFGLLSAMYGTMQFFCMPLLGALSDRFGRRPILLLSIFGFACSMLVHATAASLISLLLIRIVSGGTAASISVANAYIADITEPEHRGKAFGMLGAALGMGFIFGPVVGGLLAVQDLRLPFFFAAGMALLNFIYGFFVLPESLPKDRRSPFSFKRANPFSALLHLGKLQSIGGLIFVFALTMFAQFTLQTTWVLYTQFRFGWTPTDNGIALFVFGLMSAGVQGGLQSKLLKRFGEEKLVLVGFTSATLAYLVYGFITVGWMMYVVILANLLSFAAGPALQAIVSKAVGPAEQGVTQGSLNAISSLAIVFAPLLGTTILAKVGHLPPNDWRMGSIFYVCAGLQGLALLLAWRHFRQPANKPIPVVMP